MIIHLRKPYSIFSLDCRVKNGSNQGKIDDSVYESIAKYTAIKTR